MSWDTPPIREEIFISNLDKLKHISVLNYNDNYVCINVAPGRSMRLEPAINNEPTMTPLTIDEIRYVNNGTVFKSGMLEFLPDIEDEIYDELRIDRSKVLKLSEIRDILINPTKQGLIKIVSITSLSDFDRVRGQFQKLKYEGHKLTLDVADIIDRRTKELFNNQVKSDIQIGDAEVLPNSDKRVNELEKQLAEMKALIESLAKVEKDTAKEEAVNQEPVSPKNVSDKKKPGRPSKNTK